VITATKDAALFAEGLVVSSVLIIGAPTYGVLSSDY